jgi:hypothetical protein
MVTSNWLRSLRNTRECYSVRKTRLTCKASLGRTLFLERLEGRMLLSTFLVTCTGDNGGVDPLAGAGTGTLRQAIVDANSAGTGTASSPDLIQFNIPTGDSAYNSSTGAFTIQPLSAFPTISDIVVLDGYSQPGASPNTLTIGDNAVLKIVLDGSLAGVVDGLVIAGGNSTVRGLVVDNFGYGTGIYISRGGNNLVVGNFIGTDATGVASSANNNGLLIYSSGNTVGGVSPGDRNLISGNNSGLPNSADGGSQPGDRGIYIGNGNLLQGNYIGTGRSGTSALGNGLGIESGSNSTIGGLTATPGTGPGNLISGNTIFGIDRAGNHNLIAGNLIGTTATGQAALGNGAGVHLWGNNNTVGGTTAEARNIISGNTGVGGAGVVNAAIDIENVTGVELAGGSYNLVAGNYIGTDIAGTTSLGGQTGIVIAGAYNTIGGTTAAARNVISGNNSFGIQTIDNSAFGINFGNVVQDNYIGTDPSGTTVVRNLGYGIVLAGATHDNIIGGTDPGAGNVISGFNGILLRGIPSIGLPCTNNLVQGNLIGTDKTGTVALGNGEGIEIDFSNNNTIGGSASGAGNIIAFSSGIGVNVYSGTGNSIRGNSIHDNGGLGIDLGQDGVTLNDAAGHTGPNNFEDFPVLTSVVTNKAGNTTIAGKFNSPLQPNTAIIVDFYANPVADPSGYGEGQIYLGSLTFTMNASGAYTIHSFKPSVTVPVGYYVTANATDAAGNTSEFGPDVQATAPGNSGARGLLVDSSGTTGSGGTAGALVPEVLGVYMDDSTGSFTIDELARVEDALAGVNAVVNPYGANVTEVSSSAAADVTIQLATSTALGGQADGVLGCEDASGITLVQSWNWYAGEDGTQIGSGQYDFETVVTHELGHALGLGHRTDSASVMYATLNANMVNRALTPADLNVPDSDTTGACGLHAAAVPAIAAGSTNPVASAALSRSIGAAFLSTDAVRSLLFALTAAELPRGFVTASQPGTAPSAAACDSVFAAVEADELSNPAFALPVAKGSPVYAAQSVREGDDALFEVPMFPNLGQNGQGGGADGSASDPADPSILYDAGAPSWLDG